MDRTARNLAPPRLVSWRSWSHWSAAFEAADGRPAVFSSRTLQHWIARSRAPHAVHCTLQLLPPAALVPENTRSELESRLAVGLAVMRLVNAFTDAGQGAGISSVYELSARLGLPRMLVDIRHEAAHGALPALPLLRLAASVGLDWLTHAYWTKQAQHLLTAAVGKTSATVLPRRLNSALSPKCPSAGSSFSNSCSTLLPVFQSVSAVNLHDMRHWLHVFADAACTCSSPVGTSECCDKMRRCASCELAAVAVSNVANCLAAVSTATRADNAAMRLVLLLPLIDPDSREERSASSKQLLLDAVRAVSCSQQTALHSWVPLLREFSAVWPQFTTALASAAATALLANLECAPESTNVCASRANVALLLLDLLSSKFWIDGAPVARLSCVDSDLLPASCVQLVQGGPVNARSLVRRGSLVQYNRRLIETSFALSACCLATVLRDLSWELHLQASRSMEEVPVVAVSWWGLAVREKALALCHSCGLNALASSVESCILFKRPRRAKGWLNSLKGDVSRRGRFSPTKPGASLCDLEALEAIVSGFSSCA
jgi:hypothetical protein